MTSLSKESLTDASSQHAIMKLFSEVNEKATKRSVEDQPGAEQI